MALDAGDLARLQRIEAVLAHDDPALVEQLRSWRPSPLAPGWSVVPLWASLAFLVGFSSWMLSPFVGLTVVVVAGTAWLYVRAARRVDRIPLRRKR